MMQPTPGGGMGAMGSSAPVVLELRGALETRWLFDIMVVLAEDSGHGGRLCGARFGILSGRSNLAVYRLVFPSVFDRGVSPAVGLGLH